MFPFPQEPGEIAEAASDLLGEAAWCRVCRTADDATFTRQPSLFDLCQDLGERNPDCIPEIWLRPAGGNGSAAESETEFCGDEEFPFWPPFPL